MSRSTFLVRFNPHKEDDQRGLMLSSYRPSSTGSPEFSFPITARQALALRDSIDRALEQAVHGDMGESDLENITTPVRAAE